CIYGHQNNHCDAADVNRTPHERSPAFFCATDKAGRDFTVAKRLQQVVSGSASSQAVLKVRYKLGSDEYFLRSPKVSSAHNFPNCISNLCRKLCPFDVLLPI